MLPADPAAEPPLDDTVDIITRAGHDGQELDEESVRRLAALAKTCRERDRATGQLHNMLLRIARAELHRRGGRHPITGPELDDLAHQAAVDALLAITTKLDQIGQVRSRFATTLI